MLSSCGHATDTPPKVAQATPTSTAAPKLKPVHQTIDILTPRKGTELKAGHTVGVAGRATAGTTVLLDAGCFKSGCRTIARAGSSGRWHAELKVAKFPTTTIAASTTSSAAADRVAVKVAPTPKPKVTQTREAEPTATPRPRPTRVALVGDSLAVGIKTLLPGLLPGDRVSVNAQIGRPLAPGMAIVGRSDLESEPTVLAISLFTNDDPRNLSALDAAVRRSVSAVGPDGCAVWATIVRPPVAGVSYKAANAHLAALEAELSPHLVLVPWAEQIAVQPELIGPDHVHPTPAGYQARAALYADAIRQCGA